MTRWLGRIGVVVLLSAIGWAPVGASAAPAKKGSAPPSSAAVAAVGRAHLADPGPSEEPRGALAGLPDSVVAEIKAARPATNALLASPDADATAIPGSTGATSPNADGTTRPGAGQENQSTIFAPISPNPLVSFSTSSLTFNVQTVGVQSPSQPIDITNSGGAPLTITGLSASADFLLYSNCLLMATLGPGSGCYVRIAYQPTTVGAATGTLTVTDNAGSGSQTVGLTGTGTASAPVGQFSVGSLTFPNQGLGTISASRSATFTNTGSAPMTIPNIQQFPSGQFFQNSDCPQFPATLAAGASCTFSIVFEPNQPGTQRAILFVVNNSAIGFSRLLLSGIGTPAGAAPTVTYPASYDFGNVNLGAAASQPLTITNLGAGRLTIYAITAFGDATEADNCPAQLAAGASCTITGTVTPSAVGPTGGGIAVQSSSPSQIFIRLTANGVLPGGGTPRAVLNQLGLTFPGTTAVGSSSQSLAATMTNLGDTALTVGPISVNSYANFSNFSQSNNCGTSLAVNATCTINVTFTPLQAQFVFGYVQIPANGLGGVQFLPVQGQGVAGSGPVTQLFGSGFSVQTVNIASLPATFTVANQGGATLNISSIGAGGDFAISQNNCGSTLAVGVQCTVLVTYTPTATGIRTATFTVTDNAPGSPHALTYTLLASTATPGIALSATSLTFGTQSVGATSGSKRLTISNPGDLPLVINLTPPSGPFGLDRNTIVSCSVISPFGSCALGAVFRPVAAGAATGSISLASNGGATQTVSLAGTGTVAAAPALTLNTFSFGFGGGLGFGTVAAGTVSAALTTQLFNSGGAPLNISGVQVSAGYRQVNSCGNQVPAYGVCLLTVYFAPPATSSGPMPGFLTINSDAAEGSDALGLFGNADSTAPTAVFSAQAIDFGSTNVNSTVTRTLTLQNTGAGALVTNFLSSGLSGRRLINQTDNCGTLLLAGWTCTITLTFTPAALGQAGNFRGATGLFANVAGLRQVNLTATAWIGPLAIFSPGSTSAGIIPIGTSSAPQTITITNQGTDVLSFKPGNITTNPPFTQSTTCPSGTNTLAVGASCTISATFNPGYGGLVTSDLVTVPNAPVYPMTPTPAKFTPNNNFVYSLTGFGAGPKVATLPAMANGAYGGYTTVGYIQNLGTMPADVAIQYLDSLGHPVGSGDTISGLRPNASWTVRSDNGNGLGFGQAGSAVILSDQPVASFTNEFAPGSIGDGTSTSGIANASAASTLYAPAVFNGAYGGYTTGIGLVNLSTTTADITITYNRGDGTAQATQVLQSVAAGAYRGVYNGDGTLPQGFAGSATITATGGSVLAAVINEVGPGGQFSSYPAASAGATTLNAPTLLRNAYGGYFTGVGIQNVSATAGTVTVTYYDTSGNPTPRTFNLAANGFLGIYQGNNDGPSSDGGYTGILSSTVPIVAIVNEIAPPGGGGQQSTSYYTVAAGAATIALPLVESAGADGWSTGTGIMNTSASPTTVTVTYYDADTGYITGTAQTATVPAHAFWGVYQPTGGLPTGYRATALITASSGGTVAVICNENTASAFMSYNGQ